MTFSAKSVLLGAGAGAALTLTLLQSWGTYLDRHLDDVAQPHILRPLGHASPVAYQNFPYPWLPQDLSRDASSWKLTPFEGAPVTLAQFKGKVLFLNFWSTSCTPCIEEMPGIAKLSKSLKDERIAFVAVTGEKRSEVSSFIKENDFGVPVYFSEEEPPKDLPVPTTFILDSNGTVVFMHAGALNWDDDKTRAYLHSLASQTSAPTEPRQDSAN
jgi:thiol-disulfide isomerase/thioredoxin